jgi:hypothetical protein
MIERVPEIRKITKGDLGVVGSQAKLSWYVVPE